MLNKKTILLTALIIGCIIGIAVGSFLGFHYWHTEQQLAGQMPMISGRGTGFIGIKFNQQLKVLIGAVISVILYIAISIIISKHIAKKQR